MEIVTNHAYVTVRQTLQPLLSSREEFMWSGQPWQGLHFQRDDWWRIPQSIIQGVVLVFIGLSFFHGATSLYALMGVALWLLAFYITLGRFFADAYWRSRTYYALTNRRIIIHTTVFGTTTTSHDLPSLYHLRAEVKGNGHGTIQVGKDTRIMEMFFRVRPFLGIGDYSNSLTMIPNAQRVYELIQDVRG